MFHKPTLSVKEEEKLVQLLADGNLPVVIAKKLRINETKLAAFLRDMRTKYNCDNTLQLVVHFFRSNRVK